MNETSAINQVYLQAREILYRNPKAKYLILSVAAYDNLRGINEPFKYIHVEERKTFFMSKQIALIEEFNEIIIDVGGVK